MNLYTIKGLLYYGEALFIMTVINSSNKLCTYCPTVNFVESYALSQLPSPR